MAHFSKAFDFCVLCFFETLIFSATQTQNPLQDPSSVSQGSLLGPVSTFNIYVYDMGTNKPKSMLFSIQQMARRHQLNYVLRTTDGKEIERVSNFKLSPSTKTWKVEHACKESHCICLRVTQNLDPSEKVFSIPFSK